MKRAVRSFAVNLALVVIAAIVGLALAEFIYRFYAARFEPSAFRQSDPVIHHALKPGGAGCLASSEYRAWYRINELGMRGELPRADRRPVLFLGDSFVEGYGVGEEQTFCAILNAAWTSKGIPLQALNAGVAGYSPILEGLWLRRLLEQVRPVRVVLVLCGNDLYDDNRYEPLAGMGTDSMPVRVRPDPPPSAAADGLAGAVISDSGIVPLPGKQWLRDHLWLYRPARDLFHQMIGRGGIEHPPTEGALHPGELNYDEFYLSRGRVADPRAWARTEHYLAGIVALCRERQLPLLLAVVPFAIDVSATEWPDGRQAWGFGPGLHPSPLFGLVEEFARRSGADYLDLRAAFVAAPPDGCYYPYDGHWTPRGHQVAASAFHARLTPEL